MSDNTAFEIPLFDVGPEDAGFRVENELDANGDPKLQRDRVDQHKTSDIMYQANIFAIVHGTMTPKGKPGVLIIMDFHFVSNPQGRRFRTVDITVAFGREDRPIGSADEPAVVQMAPHGTFGMDEYSRTQEDTMEIHGSAAASSTLASLGIGGSFQRKLIDEKKSYAVLDGIPWIEVRNEGAWNSAKWHIRENRKLKNGVPPQLRTAILLSVPENTKIRAELNTEAKIGNLQKMERKVGARTGLHPVYFDSSEGKKLDLGPTLKDVDKTNLSACDLAAIGVAKTKTILPSSADGAEPESSAAATE